MPTFVFMKVGTSEFYQDINSLRKELQNKETILLKKDLVISPQVSIEIQLLSKRIDLLEKDLLEINPDDQRFNDLILNFKKRVRDIFDDINNLE